jgi:hypothetical protein
LFSQNAKKYGNSIFDLIHVDSSYKTRMLMCTPDEYDSVKYTGNVIETSWKENMFLHELSSLPNHELKRIPVSMWLRHKSETKMSLIDVRNLNKSFGTGYGQRECTRHKGLQTYFGPRYCYRPLMNPKYGEGGIKYKVDFFHQTYSNPELLLISHPKVNNAAREALDLPRSMNSSYMEFVGYEACSKVIWTSGTMKKNQK